MVAAAVRMLEDGKRVRELPVPVYLTVVFRFAVVVERRGMAVEARSMPVVVVDTQLVHEDATAVGFGRVAHHSQPAVATETQCP